MTKQQARELDEPAPQAAAEADAGRQVPGGDDASRPSDQPDAPTAAADFEATDLSDTDLSDTDLTEQAGDAAAAEGQDDKSTIAALQGEMEKLKAALAQSNDAVLRARADTENVRRRAERDVENAHKFGQEKFASALLPVLDSLELGLSAAQDDQVDIASVREGLELTLKMFAQAAEKFALEPVDPIGGAFDPEFHQAISMQDSDTSESGTVLTVVQKGYLLHGRVIRPAMVIVAK